MVCNDRRLIAADTSGRNAFVRLNQPVQHLGLALTCDQPQNAPRAIDDRIGQRHATAAIVCFGRRHVAIAHVQDRMSRHQRRSVSVSAEPEMNYIENRRLSHTLGRE